MTIDAFCKALNERPLSRQERDQLTPNELFVLVLARRLDSLTDAERRRLDPGDWQYLAKAGLISHGLGPIEASGTTVAGMSSPPAKANQEQAEILSMAGNAKGQGPES